MGGIDCADTVREQYKTANNLNKRISIHEKYSVNKQGFGNWIFSHYDIEPNVRILELGCGNGNMWRGRTDLPNGVKLVLTDISKGMLDSAKEALGRRNGISYEIADIENLPYENGSFDRIIANMMLYHVHDLDKGLCEVRRTLSDNGIFYCATFGEKGIIPYIADLLKEYGVKDSMNKRFTLQNGGDLLSNYFSEVRRSDYMDWLEVTDIDDILDYIYSMKDMISIAELKREDIHNVLERNAADGVLKIPKEYGMFVCRK